MANYTITITNSIRSFGPAPSTKWGTGTPYNMTWGTSQWGEGAQDLMIAFIKVIGNAITPDTTMINSVRKLVQNSIAANGDLSSEAITDGSGYSFVFPGSATNAENRVISTYSTAAAGSSTYTSQTAGTTNWS